MEALQENVPAPKIRGRINRTIINYQLSQIEDYWRDEFDEPHRSVRRPKMDVTTTVITRTYKGITRLYGVQG